MNEEYVWKDVGVVGFDELMQALERADRKGYMPDAVKEAWEGFNWKPAQQQEPVARSEAYDMLDRFLRNNLNSDEDYTEYSKALDSIYTPPPARPWVGLTSEDKVEILRANGEAAVLILTEAKLREKNA